MYSDNCKLLARGIVIIFLIVIFSGAIFFLAKHSQNFIKSKDKSKNPICDNEKQSKFILDCIKADTTKDVRAFGACENMSIKLYCK